MAKADDDPGTLEMPLNLSEDERRERLREMTRAMRENDLEVEEKRKEEEDKQARKNKEFTQVYAKYWFFMQRIIEDNPKAAILYNFLAEHAAPDTGAVVVSQTLLAEKMGVTRMTISRHLKYLQNHNMILKISLSGGVCAYALDPEMVWKSYSTNKEYATFLTKTLVKKIDLEKNEIHRKLNVMLKDQNQRIKQIEEEAGQMNFNLNELKKFPRVKED